MRQLFSGVIRSRKFHGNYRRIASRGLSASQILLLGVSKLLRWLRRRLTVEKRLGRNVGEFAPYTVLTSAGILSNSILAVEKPPTSVIILAGVGVKARLLDLVAADGEGRFRDE